MKLKSLVLAAAALLCALPSGAIDIIDLHQNTSTGVPTLLGQTVTVNGIITVPGGTYSDYSFEVYVQDATGGVNLYVSGGLGTFNADLGDSVTVTAPVAHYNGLTELGTSVGDVTFTNHGPATSFFPDTTVLTCAEVLNTFQGDYSEPNESRLIRINGVSIESGTWPTVPSGGNSYIDINDGTGTLLCFIDVDCEVNGSPEPDGTFDLVGILKQYDGSSPYTDGYQIQPRFILDVIDDTPGPAIVGLPYVRNVTQTSADVFFTTASPGSSEIEYGLNDSYGMTAGDAGASETEHEVALTGLSANTVYHYRIKTTDGTGTNYGEDRLLVTESEIPGQIHVYMSYDADHSYASGENVSTNQDFSALVVSMIDQATYSVDACLYSFSLDNVKDALIAAHLRGCQVRIIIDDNNSSAAADECASYGIPYITSTFGGNHTGEYAGIMHNKWIVIDAFDTNVNNDWVWTGSGNMSISGNNDVNNGLRIKDFGLAQAYTFEFDEMWGNHGPGPHPVYTKMGENKADNTPHEFTIAGVRVESYMSPSDQSRFQINEAIRSADHSIYFAILSFPDWQISTAMEDHRYDNPDLEVRGVFDAEQGPCENGSQYYDMSGDPCTPYAWDPPADVWLADDLPSSRLLHHKYMIVDVNNNSDDPLVVTGSRNWSWSAANINDENTLILHDPLIANLYLQEFAERYHESGGTGDLGVAVAVGEEQLDLSGRLIAQVSNFPNPFNPTTRVSFQTSAMADVTVAIYDAAGRRVRTLAEEQLMESGLHILGWDGRNGAGESLSSGVYLARVQARATEGGQVEQSQAKLVLVQ